MSVVISKKTQVCVSVNSSDVSLFPKREMKQNQHWILHESLELDSDKCLVSRHDSDTIITNK